jgi:hypothetical protein
MNILHTIDDWIIDRAFQPISDRLARYMSCYGIAAFLLTGVILSNLAYAVHDYSWVTLVILPVWSLPLLIEAYHHDAAPVSNVLPIFRIKYFFWRMIQLVLIPNNILLAITSSDVWDSQRWAAWTIVTAVLYFMACRRNPPKPRRAKAPITAAPLPQSV